MIVTQSNLDYLIVPTRMYVGDLSGDVFSNSIILTSLVFSVKWLQNRWNNRYLIYRQDMYLSGTSVNTPDGVLVLPALPNTNDAFRNTLTTTFASDATPVIDQDDEYPIVVASAVALRRSVITSSLSAFSNWSTPDLTFSNVSSSKAMLDLIAQDVKTLDEFFKKRLASPQKQSFPIAADEILTPYAGIFDIIPPHGIY